jgi:hypothetical protein
MSRQSQWSVAVSSGQVTVYSGYGSLENGVKVEALFFFDHLTAFKNSRRLSLVTSTAGEVWKP